MQCYYTKIKHVISRVHMISKITDNYFINICKSPWSGHYQTSLVLQHLRLDENGISLAPTMLRLSIHMIWKDKHTYPLSIPIIITYTTTRRTEFFVNINININRSKKEGNWTQSGTSTISVSVLYTSLVHQISRFSCIVIHFTSNVTVSVHHAAQNDPGHGTKILWHFLFLIYES